MDHIKKHLAKAMQPQKESLPSLINSQIVKTNGKAFLKVSSETLTKQGVANAIKKLASNFKKLDDSFFSILADRARVNGFDDKMLDNAVNSVIDNFVYAEPKVADILSFNSNVELFTYYQVIEMNDSMNRKAFEYYRPIKIAGYIKPMYASINDINKYNLEYFPVKEHKS